ncbi:helix-turn-helix domain-containing protein [Paenibacillus puldeungensis]|uniref:Helix-turn-helix domain-containing protein n=1 Tax=Paenibacillus puldeungensis TaxID=696536 RepID=A0ABW3RXT0_9BACL
MGFADKLQKYRKQNGMSQENLAEVIGVSRQAVSKWEYSLSYPDLDKLVKISELFHVSLDQLVKDTPVFDPPAFNETQDQNQNEGHGLSAPPHDRFGYYHYEYKSKTTCFGVPLVHIHFGRRPCVAKGIIAVGNIAIGALSCGIVALGGLCIGAIGVGLISLAGLALGLLLAIGGLAAGAVAVGGFALGVVAIGGLSMGMFALGGSAIASKIAIGGYASGHIAIGDTVKGAYTLMVDNHDFSSIPAEKVRQIINQEYPNLWKHLVDQIVAIFGS